MLPIPSCYAVTPFLYGNSQRCAKVIAVHLQCKYDHLTKTNFNCVTPCMIRFTITSVAHTNIQCRPGICEFSSHKHNVYNDVNARRSLTKCIKHHTLRIIVSIGQPVICSITQYKSKCSEIMFKQTHKSITAQSSQT